MRPAVVRLAQAGLPTAFLLLFLVLPLAAILGIAAPTTELGVWERSRLAQSLELGFLTSLLALVFGMPLAYLLGRHSFRGRRTLRALVTVPFVMPVVVIAAGLLAFLGPNGLVARAAGISFPFLGSYAALLVAHTIFNVPLVVRLVGDTWSHLDPRLEEAAATLGARAWTRFVGVTLPRLLPSIGAAALLAFLFGFTAFGTVLLLGDPIEHATLEVAAYHDGVRLFDLPAAATLALLQLGVTLVAALAYTRLIASASREERPVEEHAALRPLRAASWPLVALAFVVIAALLLPRIAILLRALDTPAGWSFEAFERLWEMFELYPHALKHWTYSIARSAGVQTRET
jgi:thiamine transport system permease protein